MTANKYIDKDRILRKIAYIKEEVTPLNELLQKKTFSEILKDTNKRNKILIADIH
ncbi:hypothetical protein [Carboxydothermus hydrogenoformans]|uniref:hypothetical protein n=1 Tax=Carboxydothermus hydrogenoformans TaxID=129958 RepID=UPI0003150BE6|nr:hypothetical protein [Carboxydothermus hydrogenoformans]